MSYLLRFEDCIEPAPAKPYVGEFGGKPFVEAVTVDAPSLTVAVELGKHVSHIDVDEARYDQLLAKRHLKRPPYIEIAPYGDINRKPETTGELVVGLLCHVPNRGAPGESTPEQEWQRRLQTRSADLLGGAQRYTDIPRRRSAEYIRRVLKSPILRGVGAVAGGVGAMRAGAAALPEIITVFGMLGGAVAGDILVGRAMAKAEAAYDRLDPFARRIRAARRIAQNHPPLITATPRSPQ